MHYSYALDVHSYNTVSTFAYVNLVMGSGILTRCQIHFPAGCGNNIRAVVWSKSNQILPTNPDGYYCLDNDKVDASLYYDLDAKGNTLYLLAWAVDCNYDHTIYCHLDVRGKDEPSIEEAFEVNSTLIDRLLSVIKSMV